MSMNSPVTEMLLPSGRTKTAYSDRFVGLSRQRPLLLLLLLLLLFYDADNLFQIAGKCDCHPECDMDAMTRA